MKNQNPPPQPWACILRRHCRPPAAHSSGFVNSSKLGARLIARSPLMRVFGARSAMLSFTHCAVFLILGNPVVAAQQAPATPGAKPSSAVFQKATPDGAKAADYASETPQILQQLNSALEGLAAKVSPAV